MPDRLRVLLLVVCILPLVQACSYLAQSLNGHLEVLQAREKVDDLRTNPDTPPDLRAQMDVAADIRQFAIDSLSLPDNASYRSYVDLERDYVTIAIFATPEFSLTPVTWCFPVFGCVPYRAHFSIDVARKEIADLRERGLDVHVSGVTAYSTLGWTPDPLLNTMFTYGDTNAAAVVFHELAHQQIYVRDDAAFNEAFAVTVEIEGTKAWLRARGQADAV
ncbi:MAG: aminopeptidase, partial [Pseudomonadota bacterium]